MRIATVYAPKECFCGCGEAPDIYAEGTATQDIDQFGKPHFMRWKEFDGYVVECQHCGANTDYHKNVAEAVAAWNQRNLRYFGDSEVKP